MKNTLFMALLCAGIAQAGAAQTRQSSVEGATTGDPTYSLRVVGSDGLVYKCLPTLETRGAERIRRCLPAEAPVATTPGAAAAGTAATAGTAAGAGAASTGVLAGTALGTAGATAAAVVGLGAILLSVGDNSSATTTTTTTN